MKDATLLGAGIAGSIVAAVCCATPILAIGLGAIGLSAWLDWADFVLGPVLVLFLGVIAYGLWRRQKSAACCAGEMRSKREEGRHG